MRSIVPGDDFEWLEATIAELSAAIAGRTLTARSLTEAYLQRIAEFDAAGPRINSIIELNPDALASADELDRELAEGGPRGPLHGIPVLIKDNIATCDDMETTAGSLALVGIRPNRDAFVVRRLRDHGAVLLGKTNLSEWANIRSTRSTSGWSGRGGLSRNPYALDRTTSGSSSGSAAAVAANLCVVAVGTETDGSITSPSSVNGLVGIKPTVGLISRDGIIPISQTQDTAGPMARTVADAATLLTVLAGPDDRDPATSGAPRLKYESFVDPGRIEGARLGVVRSHLSKQPEVDAMFDRLLARLVADGAVLVDDLSLPAGASIETPEFVVLLRELKDGLREWFAEFVPDSGVTSLADLIEWNRAHGAAELAWFGQELFEAAEATNGRSGEAYRDALSACRQLAHDRIDALLGEHRLDALIAPTGGVAWMIDLVNGDNFGGSFSTPAAVAGYPHITIPMGQVHELPAGVSIVGPPWSEPTLVALASAVELAAAGRQPPTFATSLPTLR
jgi:amidase